MFRLGRRKENDMSKFQSGTKELEIRSQDRCIMNKIRPCDKTFRKKESGGQFVLGTSTDSPFTIFARMLLFKKMSVATVIHATYCFKPRKSGKMTDRYNARFASSSISSNKYSI